MHLIPSPTPTPQGDGVIPIWQIDWSQFVPDAILTVVTGVAIGLWLWRVQSRAEHKADRRQAVSMWKIARAEFAGPVGGVKGYGTWEDIERQYADFREAAMRYPLLGAWADADPKNEELQAATKILTTLPLIRRFGIDLDLTLDEKVGDVVSDPNEQKHLTDAFHWVIQGMGYGGTTTGQWAEEHREWIDILLNDPRLRVLADRYEGTKYELSAAHHDLRFRLTHF